MFIRMKEEYNRNDLLSGKKNNRVEGKHSVNSVANSNCLHSLL